MEVGPPGAKVSTEVSTHAEFIFFLSFLRLFMCLKKHSNVFIFYVCLGCRSI